MAPGFVLQAERLPNRPLGLQEITMKTVQAMLAAADAELPRLSPQAARTLTGRADVLFLDVREPVEVAASS